MLSRIGLAVLLWFACLSAIAQFQPSHLSATTTGERPGVSQLPVSAVSEDVPGYVGNEACAGCHAVIYQSYARTSMARASGPAIQNVVPADFFHRSSDVHYRVYSETGHIWLSLSAPEIPRYGENGSCCTTSARDGAV